MTPKIMFTVSILLFSFTTIFAQKEVKYKKLYYKNQKVENANFSILVENAVSTEGETKFKLKITNKSGDYMIYKPEESKFVINGADMKPNEKWLIISPYESDFRIINLKGGKYNAVKNYSFILDGLYKVIVDTGRINAPDFKLPVSQNDFKAGNFTCNMTKLSKETDRTDIRFACTYNGDKIGFVSPAKVAVKMPDGNEYANARSKARPIIFFKGKEDDFTLSWERIVASKSMDMQKAEMIIKWRDAFTEATPEKMKSETIELQFDEATSNEKGK